MTARQAVDDRSPGESEQLLRTAVVGGFALAGRQVAVQGLNVVGSILLARALGPHEFGWYAVGAFVLSVLVSFGDVGFGASLVRAVRMPSAREWQSVFGVQAILALVATLVVVGFAPTIASAYGDVSRSNFFRILGVAMLFVPLQAMATASLERRLQFRAVASVEVAQALCFNVVAVAMAYSGFGVMSIAYAIALRALTGAVLASFVGRWPFGIGLDRGSLAGHLRFGAPYQAASMLNLLRWSITPVFVGLLLGATQVGYIFWAQTVATFAVAGMYILQRLYLPLFSRLMDRREALALVVERSVTVSNAIVAPASVVLLVLIEPATRIVYGDAWLPAVPIFLTLWIANVPAATAGPLLGLINASGRSAITLTFTAVWLVGTWVLGIPLILAFGPIGYGYASAAIQVTSLALFAVAKRIVPLRLLHAALPPWLAAIIAGAATLVVRNLLPPTDLVVLIGEAVIGGVVFTGAYAVIEREAATRLVRRALGRRSIRAA